MAMWASRNTLAPFLSKYIKVIAYTLWSRLKLKVKSLHDFVYNILTR